MEGNQTLLTKEQTLTNQTSPHMDQKATKAEIQQCWHSLEPQFTYRKRTDRGSFPLRVLPQGLSIRGSEANRLEFTI